MTVEVDLSNTSYVSVEIVKKDASKATDIDPGLFMGVCVRKDSKDEVYNFITIMTDKNTIKLYNKTEYDVVSIDVVNENTKYTTIYNKSDKDQSEALNELKYITKYMIETRGIGYPNDNKNELIDPTYYKEYPKDLIGKELVLNKDTNKSSNSSNNFNRFNNHNSSSTYNRSDVDKEPVLSKIKRKGKLPNTEKLTTMKDKVKRIASGEYKLDPIPIPDCDKEGAEKEKDKDFRHYNKSTS